MALYRKYRPDSFEKVVGQEKAVEALSGSLKGGKMGHAILLSGPHGIGKTTLARLVAQCLVCEEAPVDQPCGKCKSCQAFNQGNHPDLLEMDAASNRGVDDARSIRDRLNMAPMLGGCTVLIIDEAHMLTREAQNALLKTLEEPPPGVHFIFATTAPDKMLATIRSRCQRYMLAPPSEAELTKAVAYVAQEEGIACDQQAMEAICSAASGSYRDALSLLDQAASSGEPLSAESIKAASGLPGTRAWEGLCLATAEGQGAKAAAVVSSLVSSGFDLRSSLAELERYLRLVIYLQAGELPEGMVGGAEEISSAKKAAAVLSPEALWKLVEGIEFAYQTAAFGGSAALALESRIFQASGPVQQPAKPPTQQQAPQQAAEQPQQASEQPQAPQAPQQAAEQPQQASEQPQAPQQPQAAEQPEEKIEDKYQPMPSPEVQSDQELPGPAVAAAAFPLLRLALRTSHPQQYLTLRTAWAVYEDKRLIIQMAPKSDKEQTKLAIDLLKRMVNGSVRAAVREKVKPPKKVRRQGDSPAQPAEDPSALLASMGMVPLEGELRSDQKQAGQNELGPDTAGQ
jgi:DNA polymerase-3 subunit gamma/tau